jgi:hypothetical protein
LALTTPRLHLRVCSAALIVRCAHNHRQVMLSPPYHCPCSAALGGELTVPSSMASVGLFSMLNEVISMLLRWFFGRFQASRGCYDRLASSDGRGQVQVPCDGPWDQQMCFFSFSFRATRGHKVAAAAATAATAAAPVMRWSLASFFGHRRSLLLSCTCSRALFVHL